MKAKLDSRILVRRFAMHANSPEFGVAVAEEFLSLIKSKVA
jgi:hypothetical protein